MAEIRKAQPQANMPAEQVQQQNPWMQCYSWKANGDTVSVTPNFVMANVMKGDEQYSLHDVIEFILFCRANKLDPIAKDCYPVKYQGRMSMLSSVASFEKRAESFPEYDGMEFGLMVLDDTGAVIQRDGQFKLPNEKIVGGWCKVYRKDRSYPTYVALDFNEYNTGKSLWKEKPAVMITKCAEAMALRKAFPKQNSNLYIREELGEMENSKDKKQMQNFRQVPNSSQTQKSVDKTAIEHNYVEEIQRINEAPQEKVLEPVEVVEQPKDDEIYISDNMFE